MCLCHFTTSSLSFIIHWNSLIKENLNSDAFIQWIFPPPMVIFLSPSVAFTLKFFLFPWPAYNHLGFLLTLSTNAFPFGKSSFLENLSIFSNWVFILVLMNLKITFLIPTFLNFLEISSYSLAFFLGPSHMQSISFSPLKFVVIYVRERW